MPAASRTPVVRNKEQGYILLTLIFFVAVLVISLATILPSVIQEAKRDREEELVHRGAQYTRAIRLYFRKNGRYPAKIEDLENTNNIRYLRKRYKDPMGKGENGGEAEFKVLRFGDPGVRLQLPGQGTVPAQAPQALGKQGADAAAALTQLGRAPAAATPAATDETQSADANSGTPGTGAPATDANDAAAPSNETTGTSADAAGHNATYGGGAMVGVASLSTKDSIREFNKKHKYNEWQFLFDPQDRSQALPSGPWQPQKFPGQAGGPQTVGTPADQISNPVGQPAGGPGANPNPAQPPQE